MYRLGFGASRKEARQLVNHGHMTINGRKVNAPGALVKAGDAIEFGKEAVRCFPFKAALERSMGEVFRNGSSWTEAAFKGMIRSLPTKDHIVAPGERANGRGIVFAISDLVGECVTPSPWLNDVVQGFTR